MMISPTGIIRTGITTPISMSIHQLVTAWGMAMRCGEIPLLTVTQGFGIHSLPIITGDLL